MASSSSGEPGTAPQPNRWYELRLGSSCRDPSPTAKYCTLRYEFKPASIDKTQVGSLQKTKDNRVTVEFHNNQPGKPKVTFEGSQEEYKDNDGVLFFDGETFRLERLHRAVKRLRHVRVPGRSSQPNKPTPACSSSERANIDALLFKLCSPDPEEQRSAAAELRLLAKRNANNRICIAEAGAIPLLLSLLSSSDLRTQEHAVTALLNLSIHEDNKASIMSSGAVPSIVHVLKNGSMEARENAAATLFSLSVIDEYKVIIGGTGAIPALVVLLSEGSQRGKKDAAAALFNLCIYQGNKGRAIRAGLVPLIMGLVTNPTGALMDEAMAILSILSSHQEGKAAIGAAEPVPVLVEMIGSGTTRNRENAAAVMLHLCSGEQQHVHLARAQECGIMVPLRELALNGTERGKRKAVQLLERMSRFLVQQQEEQESQLQASAQVLPQAPEQVQESDIPEQLDSPAPQYPMLV